MELELLIVDDDEVDVLAVERVFAKAKLTNSIHIARDGASALAVLRARTQKRWLVLLDLEMPRMSGIELLRAMRADAALAGIPVLVMTTSIEDRERPGLEPLRLEIAGYLAKPITFRAFLEATSALGRRWTLS
jgi:CheY-like chemotaxis protein